MGIKLTFSGHESFICKQFWLKKVYDFTAEKKKFADENSVVELGVGKNMVASLRYWGRAFSIMDDNDQATILADYLFSKKGQDPYLEDIATIWLLHYHLVKANKASIYNFVFNEFRKERQDFTKDQLHGFLKRRCEELSPSTYNINTINTDINVFLRNYVKPHRDDKVEVEDDFCGIMLDLELIKSYKQKNEQGIITRYKIEGQERLDFPAEILLYSILDNYEGQRTIDFRELLYGTNSPGSIFMLNAEGLYNGIMRLANQYNEIVYTETAGNQILQLKGNLTPKNVLNGYYNR